MEKFRNVVEGEISNGLPMTLKLFDLQVTDALQAFVQEQEAYKKLETLQEHRIPILYVEGASHTTILFI
jgi:hypothetical protein